jgi:predicted naringenin-chalcone synthase
MEMGIPLPMDHFKYMSVKIVAVVSQLPKYSRTTEEIMPFLDVWLEGQEPRFIKKVKKIFEGAAVDKRYSIMEPSEVFTATSFEEKNNIYIREAIDLGEKVLVKALEKARWKPEDLDYIITVSCTGIMIPSLDAYLVNKLKLRQDIVRLPVTEMGCAAGISGIIYAKNFLKANPGKKAAVIAVESPTATFQLDDYSMANIVSAAIFGDGAACVLLSSEENDNGPEIVAEEMYHFFDAEHMMGFSLTNKGLQMVLDVEVPETIASHFPEIINPFLEKNDLRMDDIDHLIFHPGGKKIIQTVEELFADLGKNINDTKEVLRLYGNMSSATVIYVLERIMENQPKKGERGLMLSFGPGFSAQRVLLQW